MKIKSIKHVLVIIFCVIGIKTPHAEKIHVDCIKQDRFITIQDSIPPLNIMVQIIEADEVHNGLFGQGIETQMAVKSIRAFIGWLREFIVEDKSVLVYRLPPAFVTFGVNPDNKIAAQKRIKEVDEIMNQYDFSCIREYPNIEVKELLTSDKVIVMVRSEANSFETKVRIDFLIPINDKTNLDDFSKREFIMGCFHYDYELGLDTSRFPNHYSRKKIITNFIKDVFDYLTDVNGYNIFSFDEETLTPSYELTSNFKWNLTTITLTTLESVTYDLNDVPKSIYDLF